MISILIMGCSMIDKSPTKAVSSFFQKYQNLDTTILKDLDTMIENTSEMNRKQKEEYKSLFIRQYQNLSYKIKKEEMSTNKKESDVEVEIEVLNYQEAKVRAKQKVIENNEENYIDLQLQEMKQTTSKIKYDLTIHLENRKGNWIIRNLTEEDIKKIHGIFEYY